MTYVGRHRHEVRCRSVSPCGMWVHPLPEKPGRRRRVMSLADPSPFSFPSLYELFVVPEMVKYFARKDRQATPDPLTRLFDELRSEGSA